MAIKSPQAIFQAACTVGTVKADLSRTKQILLGFLAGAFIAFGGLLAIVVGKSNTTLAAANPGLAKLVFASVFPVGIVLVVIAGAELFTGNVGILTPSYLMGSVKHRPVLQNWFWVYVGNFVGSVFVALVLSYWTEIVNVNSGGLAAQLGAATVKIAEAKVNMGWMTLFLRGLGANWLVCLAVGLSIAADDVFGKIAGLWFPIMAFVAMGFEHSVANMFFVPLGMLNGADVTMWQFIAANLVPVTLGNIVGGAVFVGAAYWWAYGRG